MAVEHRIFHTGAAAAEALGALWRADIVQMDAGPMKVDVRTAIVGYCGLTELTTTRQLLRLGERRRASGRCLSADRAGVYSRLEGVSGSRVRRVEREPGVN